MDGGSGTDDVVNRRVNSHIQQLLPAQVSGQKDYQLEGQRWLAPDDLPGSADPYLCLLQSHVGRRGQFAIHVTRVFDPQTDSEWRIENVITRSGAGSLSPFTYLVTTAIELLGEVETDRARVSWKQLGDDPIYGGREAQAAVLLTEKMSHLRARECGRRMDHDGSLSRLGSLSNVIDTGRQLQTDWVEVDDLLGPGADTIAATVGFDALESDPKRIEAKTKGIDFLTDDIEDLQRTADRSDRPNCDQSGSDQPSWKTPPAELSVEETEFELQKLQRELEQMKREFGE